uniref:ATPase inhibitor, mitochondrial n=1 Tax=Astyanax mexicanus TaxID=7994 RepID=A0A3B1IL75_ASTMX
WFIPVCVCFCRQGHVCVRECECEGVCTYNVKVFESEPEKLLLHPDQDVFRSAEEEMYFKRKEQEQLASLRQHHKEEIDHHKKEIERIQQEISRHEGKIRKLEKND